MNVSMPIAAVLLDLGFATATVKAIPLLARTASLLAHLAEEQERPVGFLMAGTAEEAIAYERGRRPGPRTMLDPAVETRPWDEQLALDDPPTASSSPTCWSAPRSTGTSSAPPASRRRRTPGGSPTWRACR